MEAWEELRKRIEGALLVAVLGEREGRPVVLAVKPGEAVALVCPDDEERRKILRRLALMEPLRRGQVILDGIDAVFLDGTERELLKRHHGLRTNLGKRREPKPHLTAPEVARGKRGGFWGRIFDRPAPEGLGHEEALREMGIGPLTRWGQLGPDEREAVLLIGLLCGRKGLVIINDPFEGRWPSPAERAWRAGIKWAKEIGSAVIIGLSGEPPEWMRETLDDVVKVPQVDNCQPKKLLTGQEKPGSTSPPSSVSPS